VTECLVCGKTIPDERKANRAKTCSSECSDTHTKNLKRTYNKRMIDSGKNLLQKKSIALRHEINKSELNEDIKKELLHKITHATKPEEITKIRILKREYINKITIKTCALCGKEIPFDINIKGWHKLKYCIDESTCTGTRPRSKSIRKPKEKTKHMCVICGNLIINNGTKYCSPLCKKEVKRRESEKARRDKGIVPRDIAAIIPKVNRVKIVRTEKENLELKLSKYRKLLEDILDTIRPSYWE
jgi:predicted nucleic acid-binding Zn ribbon protein